MHFRGVGGFHPSAVAQPVYQFNEKIIRKYEDTRNFPALDATSRIGAHLRFGTLSVRKMVRDAAMEENNPTFLKELIWREFFMQILWHFPHTHQACFKPQYERIEWRNDRGLSPLVRRENRLPFCRCWYARTQRYRIYAQPRSYVGGKFPL